MLFLEDTSKALKNIILEITLTCVTAFPLSWKSASSSLDMLGWTPGVSYINVHHKRNHTQVMNPMNNEYYDDKLHIRGKV